MEPCIKMADTPEGLSVAWDLLVEGVEQEILLRHDIVGAAQKPYVGRAGCSGTRWTKLQWRPPHRRPVTEPRVKAWMMVSKWTKRYFEVGRYLIRQFSSPGWGEVEEQVRKVARTLDDFANFHLHVCRNPLLAHIEPWVKKLLCSGLHLFRQEDLGGGRH